MVSPITEFQHVTKTFLTGQVALEEVSFTITPGEFVFLVGESGAGKTTLMKLLTGEYLANAGEILWQGKEIKKLRRGELPKLRREIGVVFQDYKLLIDRTVAENVSLALEIIGESKHTTELKVEELLRLVGLEGKAGFFPRQLSGGEAQRVSIARALATSPKLLFADEPTGNLDHETAESIVKLFRKINTFGTTILMATHNLELVKKYKHRELHLNKGRLVKDTGSKPERKEEERHPSEHAEESREKKDNKEKKDDQDQT